MIFIAGSSSLMDLLLLSLILAGFVGTAFIFGHTSEKCYSASTEILLQGSKTGESLSVSVPSALIKVEAILKSCFNQLTF